VDTGSRKSISADDCVIAPMSAEITHHDSADRQEGCHEVYDNGVLRITRGGIPPVLAIAGEVDESTYSGLVGTLEKLVDGQAEVHASLAGVEYCDLAGLRAIVRLAGGCGGGRGGRRLVLHDVPPELKTILQIMGWDATPGLVIDEPRQEPSGWS
jgi:ABC-type transporter Mla MlaB component